MFSSYSVNAVTAASEAAAGAVAMEVMVGMAGASAAAGMACACVAGLCDGRATYTQQCRKVGVLLVGGLLHHLFCARCTFTTGRNWRGIGITAPAATTTTTPTATHAATMTVTGPTAPGKNNWHGEG
jgi:hypothetical protein